MTEEGEVWSDDDTDDTNIHCDNAKEESPPSSPLETGTHSTDMVSNVLA